MNESPLTIYETERLSIREISFDDAPFLLVLLNEPGWIEHIGDQGVRTEDDAREYADTGPMRSYRKHGFGLYLVTTNEKIGRPEPIGICGLLQRDSLPVPDLGFAFLGSAGGRGFATEAGRAILNTANEKHGLDRVLAVTAPGNAASIRVLSKLGFVELDDHAVHAMAIRSRDAVSRVFECRLSDDATPR